MKGGYRETGGHPGPDARKEKGIQKGTETSLEVRKKTQRKGVRLHAQKRGNLKLSLAKHGPGKNFLF